MATEHIVEFTASGTIYRIMAISDRKDIDHPRKGDTFTFTIAGGSSFKSVDVGDKALFGSSSRYVSFGTVHTVAHSGSPKTAFTYNLSTKDPGAIDTGEARGPVPDGSINVGS